jgi:hypothetical protein
MEFVSLFQIKEKKNSTRMTRIKKIYTEMHVLNSELKVEWSVATEAK